jgi:CubicO group peptidase (beta-lactamase class C family)
VVDRLKRSLPQWMAEATVPGAAIAIIADGRLAWRGGFGIIDRASGKAVDHATMFEAASMSKPAFAYVVMKLCEMGLMKLDTPLTRYTSDRFLAGDSRLEQITARHVLSHTSGFQNWRSEKDPLSIHFTPGERYLYSGEGYNYLQTVVTRLLGQPFESYMKERLLAPMGMASSGYVWNDTFARRMARPHDAEGKPLENKKSTAQAVARYGSAGALLTTPSDFAKFIMAIIAPGPHDTFHLAPATIAEMLRPHVKLEGGRYPASWALGWQIFHNADRDFIYHGGDNEGFHCFAVASVAGRSGLVVMTNGEGGTTVLQRVLIDGVTQAFLTN